jgi:copper chaperone
MSQSTYTVTGMTCGHCAASVTGEVSRIDGVQDVQVDVKTGLVTVTTARELGDNEIRAAVTEAGYQLAG